MKKLIVFVLVVFFAILFFNISAKKPIKQEEFANNSRLPIKNIIIVVQENHSFDSYFGTYKGANGLDLNTTLPTVKGGLSKVMPIQSSGSAVYQEERKTGYHELFDFGREDSNGTVNMVYYDRDDIPNYWTYADNFVLLDNMFGAVKIRYSIPSHLYIIAATASGWMTNKMEKSFLTSKTIMDLLESKGISWKYYSGDRVSRNVGLPEGWHAPLMFKQIKDNKIAVKNIVPVETIFEDIKKSHLPKVSWVISTVEKSEHPPYDIRNGMNFVTSVINTIMKSTYWKDTAIIIIWDDYGFFYDHVSPPKMDEFGPGPRVPGIIVSAYAKKGYIDHTFYTISSPLKLIETIYGLSSLTNRDGLSENMLEAFDFKKKPRRPLVLPTVQVEK